MTVRIENTWDNAGTSQSKGKGPAGWSVRYEDLVLAWLKAKAPQLLVSYLRHNFPFQPMMRNDH